MKRYIVLVSTFVCGLFYVQAETLTLDECRSRALEYNKSLASSRLQIQKQEADLKVSWDGYYKWENGEFVRYRQ